MLLDPSWCSGRRDSILTQCPHHHQAESGSTHSRQSPEALQKKHKGGGSNLLASSGLCGFGALHQGRRKPPGGFKQQRFITRRSGGYVHHQGKVLAGSAPNEVQLLSTEDTRHRLASCLLGETSGLWGGGALTSLLRAHPGDPAISPIAPRSMSSCWGFGSSVWTLGEQSLIACKYSFLSTCPKLPQKTEWKLWCESRAPRLS